MSVSAVSLPLAAAHGRDPGSDAPDFIDVIAENATRRSHHPAVEGPDATLTYAELDRLSNQLAQRFVAAGVGRDSCVGISLPRGAGELVAMLATIKAGGAYVPLDPSHPVDRLQVVLEDAAPQVMVIHPGSPLAGAASARNVIVLDDLAHVTEGYDSTPPIGSHDPAQLAYVLFTSGSTGRPKGVEIPRGAFSNFLRSMVHEPGLSETDRLLAVSTTSFDIAGLELFLPLCVGATTVIADRATVMDPRLLRQRLETDDITFMQATPATWRLLLEAGWKSHGKLKMLCGGEAMSSALAERLLAGGGELWNMYGPTETTVWSSLQRIAPGTQRISIGKPIDRTQIYALDEQRQPVALDAVGELYIGGDGLARGYRGRPDLTAERFVQNPGGPAGDRIYRTGDLGRMSADGTFECLGRIDHQVKIRGYRIELGEIESVLRGVEDVREVLVVAEDQEGDPRLAAYWVGKAERDALVGAARRALPPYMVPSSYVRLESFPLTPNGKIDRKNLPRGAGVPLEAAPLKRPSDDTETRLAAIWCQVLGVETRRRGPGLLHARWNVGPGRPDLRADREGDRRGDPAGLVLRVVHHRTAGALRDPRPSGVVTRRAGHRRSAPEQQQPPAAVLPAGREPLSRSGARPHRGSARRGNASSVSACSGHRSAADGGGDGGRVPGVDSTAAGARALPPGRPLFRRRRRLRGRPPARGARRDGGDGGGVRRGLAERHPDRPAGPADGIRSHRSHQTGADQGGRSKESGEAGLAATAETVAGAARGLRRAGRCGD